jgi:hypothetical protein
VDVSSSAGIAVSKGNGLGIVAGDFDDSGRINLFVSNDFTPNFYFVNQTKEAGASPRFVDRGLVSGLAYDMDGRLQACMGVAVDDTNGDGLLDIFVTNYSAESNTLYRQVSPELFVDETRQAALREPSFPLVTFGTQFLDADLDGLPDVVVTTGGLVGERPEMQPQFFRNMGDRFEESDASRLGPYFQSKHVGRGLARLDWNRDGLEDFVVSDLVAPSALLTNRTAKRGHFLAVHLRGVRSSRDAIGTRVTLKLAGRTIVRQLMAGDGYMASNQRQLVFGLGDNQRVDELQVRWPFGLTRTLHDLPADREIVLIEGQEAPVVLPKPQQLSVGRAF